jgi:hypothetical protein
MKCYIVTWKPEVGAYSKKDFDTLKVDLREQGFVDSNWRMRSTSAEKGDCVLIFRQGKETGLMGFGEIMSTVSPDEEGVRRCKVRIHNLRDSSELPYLTKQALTDAGIPISVFNVQASGSRALSITETELTDSLCRSSLGHPLDELCRCYKDSRQRQLIFNRSDK